MDKFYKHPYQNSWSKPMTFARPFTKDGEPTVYCSILLFLHRVGQATKAEILINGLGRTEPFYDPSPYGHKNNQFKDTTAGYLSKMFASMRHAGLIQYSTGTKTWSLGPRYEEWKNWLRTGKSMYNPD